MNYAAVDSTNALHPFYYDSSNNSQLRAIDGSKLMFQSSTSAPYNFLQRAATGAIIDSEGTRYSQGAMVNTLGNTVVNVFDPSTSTFTTTDSVGRTIPYPTPYPTGSTPSTAECPDLSKVALFQPLVGSKNWVVPGPNGGTSTYILCYANVTVHTNFWGHNGQGTISDQGHETTKEETFTLPALQSVVLPDGTSWGFINDSADPNNPSSYAYATLNQLRFLKGSFVTYSYVSTVYIFDHG